MHRPGPHRGQRVGHPAAGVVVQVDADVAVHVGHDGRHRLGDVGGQGAAVGVAQHHRRGARGGRGLQHPQAELGIVAIAVEEVLGVEEHPLARAHQELHRVGHHGHSLIEAGLQRLGDVVVPALADDANRRRSRRGQVGQHLVGVHPSPGPAGGAEGDQLADLQVELGAGPLEELVVLGVGAGPATLDACHAETVELLGDAQLVVDGERDALKLGAVAQGGVVDLHRGSRRGIAAHGYNRPAPNGPPTHGRTRSTSCSGRCGPAPGPHRPPLWPACGGRGTPGPGRPPS